MEKGREIMHSEPLVSQKRIPRFREVKPFAWDYRANMWPGLEASVLAPSAGFFPLLYLGVRWPPLCQVTRIPGNRPKTAATASASPRPFSMFPVNMGIHFWLTAPWGTAAKSSTCLLQIAPVLMATFSPKVILWVTLQAKCVEHQQIFPAGSSGLLGWVRLKCASYFWPLKNS